MRFLTSFSVLALAGIATSQVTATGELTADQALPHHTDNQRCLLDMHCHVDCYNDAVYGRPPGEPSPFAHQ